MNARFVLVMGPTDLAPLKSKIAGFGRGGLGFVRAGCACCDRHGANCPVEVGVRH